MKTSQASAAIIHLTSLLQQRPRLTAITVLEEPATPEELGTEYIIVATEVNLSQDYASLGARSRDEDVTITGVLATKAPGNVAVAQANRERAWELLAEIEQVVKGDPSLGGVGYNAHVSRALYRPFVDDTGRVGIVEFDVSFLSRLTG